MEEYRTQGRLEFERGDYAAALQSFQAAFSVVTSPENTRSNENNHRKDAQLLLSNIVACRLKLGQRDHIKQAVLDAQKCIEYDVSWSKGYVRLASAYLALGDHSNHACNALQTAIRFDPQNRVARQMLIQELSSSSRSDRPTSQTTTTTSTPPASTEATSSELEREEEYPRDPPFNPSYVPPPPSGATTATTTTTGNSTFSNYFGRSNRNERTASHSSSSAQQPTIPWNVRLWEYISRIQNWYQSLSEDSRTAVHGILFLLILYVAFGGRFGLSSLFSTGDAKPYDDYDNTNNIYQQQQYYRQDHRQQQHQQGSAAYVPPNQYQQREYQTTHSRGHHEGSSMGYQNQHSRSQQPNHQGSEQHRQQQETPPTREQHRHQDTSYNDHARRHHDDSHQQHHHHHQQQQYNAYNHGGGYNSYSSTYNNNYASSSSFFNNFHSSEWSGMLYIGLTMAAVAIGHRFGISPWQIMMVLRMLTGRGGGFMYHGGGGFGGFPQRQYNRGRRYW